MRKRSADVLEQPPTKKQRRILKKLGINAWAVTRSLAAQIICSSEENGGQCPERYLKQFPNVRRKRILPPDPPTKVVWCEDVGEDVWWDDSALSEGWEAEDLSDAETKESEFSDEEGDGEGDNAREAEDLEDLQSDCD